MVIVPTGSLPLNVEISLSWKPSKTDVDRFDYRGGVVNSYRPSILNSKFNDDNSQRDSCVDQ